MAISSLHWAKGMRVLDRLADWRGRSAGYAFAVDELLGRAVGAGAPAICHLWRHPRAMVIGAGDGRLPGAAAGVQWLEAHGIEAHLRNSGGAAVPLDLGVVNVSLIMPLSAPSAYGFRDDFERMYALMRLALAPLGVEVIRGEVAGSYCPGDYDLQVEGRKFCGIAQRRQVKAIIVQAFVNVEGPAAERAELARGFYDRAGAGAEPGAYPHVQPARMASLAECGAALPAGARTFAAAIAAALGASAGEAAVLGEDGLPDEAAVVEAVARHELHYPLPR